MALIGAGLGIGTVLLLVVLGQRSDDDALRSTRSAEVVPAADCLAPEVLDAFGLRLDAVLATAGAHEPAPAAGRVPSSFSPVGVVVCQAGGTLRDGSGTWSVVTATTREGTATAIAALRAALEGAPAPVAPSGRPSTCSTSPADRMELWLVDSMGRAVRPQTPTDGCGRPTEAVRHALDALTVTDQSDAPVSLVAPATPAPTGR